MASPEIPTNTTYIKLSVDVFLINSPKKYMANPMIPIIWIPIRSFPKKMVPPQIIQPFSIGIFHLNHPAIGVVVPTAPVEFQAHQDGVALGGVRKVLGDGSSH